MQMDVASAFIGLSRWYSMPGFMDLSGLPISMGDAPGAVFMKILKVEIPRELSSVSDLSGIHKEEMVHT